MMEGSFLRVVGGLHVTADGPVLPRLPCPQRLALCSKTHGARACCVAFFVVIGIKSGQKDIPLQKCFPVLPRDCDNKNRKRERGGGERAREELNNLQGEVV